MSFNREQLPEPVGYYEGQGLRLSARGKWRTTECRFHGGSDSMRVNVATGGWCCMACGVKGGDVLAFHMEAHGLQFIDAARQLGAWIEDGKKPASEKPAPLSPRAALQLLAFETTLAAVAAGNLAQGVVLTDRDRSRLAAAAGRINFLAEAFQ